MLRVRELDGALISGDVSGRVVGKHRIADCRLPTARCVSLARSQAPSVQHCNQFIAVEQLQVFYHFAVP